VRAKSFLPPEERLLGMTIEAIEPIRRAGVEGERIAMSRPRRPTDLTPLAAVG
jgi:hypothetical protein